MLKDWSKFEEEKNIKENNITHLSTWIIVRDPLLRVKFSEISGEGILPIKLRLRFYGEEIEHKAYSNKTVEELL